MSWLLSAGFVNSLCSPAQVAEFSAGTCSAGKPSAPSNGSHMPQAYLSPDKTTAFSRRSLSGMTFAHLTEDRGADLLTWFRAGFHARTSASQEAARGLTENAPGSGEKWSGSFAKWSPSGFSRRTPQLSLLADSEPSSVTWPRSGLMRRGECYPLATLAHGMRGSASGSLPTLDANQHKYRLQGGSQQSSSLEAMARRGELSMLPTLTVCGNYNRKGASTQSGDDLHTKLATLCARDYRFPGKSRMERTGSKAGDPLPQQLGGPLNPTWCEWFMGFPLEWTALKPLAMPRFQEWQQQHSLNLHHDFRSKAA